MAEYEEFKSAESKNKNKEGDGSQEYGETGGAFREKVGSGAQNVKEKFRQGFDQTREQSKRAAETIGHQVEEKPLISLLLAFGAGFLLGKMLSEVMRGGPERINQSLQSEGNPPPAM